MASRILACRGGIMFPWQQVFELVLKQTLAVYFEPAFWLIVGFLGVQYWQIRRNQQRMFGTAVYSLRHQIILAAFYGTIGGVLASFLLTFTGITLNKLGFNYIWPLALLLMLISPRFLCFAYAGGLVALSSVVFGWPDVNVPQVLSLVAILHITESLLIAISSRHGAMPMFIKHNNGELVGAFSLQNFWPLPLVLLVAVGMPAGETPAGSIKMAEWWPLVPLGIDPPEGQRWIYAMMPVVAALGYTDMAITTFPHKRRMKSAFHLAVYSIVLLTLALLSAKIHWLEVVAALVCPLGHELLIQLDNKQETEGKPLFLPPDKGVMVLDTVLDTPARKIGLQPGDIIYSLGGMLVNCGSDLAAAILYAPQQFNLVYSHRGKTKEKLVKFLKDERRLGVILVPEGHEQFYAVMTKESFAIVTWIRRLMNK